MAKAKGKSRSLPAGRQASRILADAAQDDGVLLIGAVLDLTLRRGKTRRGRTPPLHGFLRSGFRDVVVLEKDLEH